MSILSNYAAHDLGTQGEKHQLFSKNHLAASSLTPAVQEQIRTMVLRRVAGNVYECPASRSYWEVKNGKVVRLSADEVDDGESIPAAPADNPMSFISNVLSDLDF